MSSNVSSEHIVWLLIDKGFGNNEVLAIHLTMFKSFLLTIYIYACAYCFSIKLFFCTKLSSFTLEKENF